MLLQLTRAKRIETGNVRERTSTCRTLGLGNLSTALGAFPKTLPFSIRSVGRLIANRIRRINAEFLIEPDLFNYDNTTNDLVRIRYVQLKHIM